MSDSKGKWKDGLGGTKDALGLVRELIVIAVLLLLLMYPQAINDRLVKAGFTKADIAGFTWEKAQKALEQTGEASQQVEAVTKKLLSVRESVDQLSQQSGDPQIRRSAEVLKTDLTQSLQTTRNTEQDLKASLAVQETILQSAQPEGMQETGPWGIVISADKGVPEAQFDANRARSLGYGSVTVYYRKNWFRPVVEFPNLVEAQAALPRLRSEIRSSSYLVNMAKWCPVRNRIGNEGVLQCVIS